MSYARKQAEHDIRQELKKEDKVFIPYFKYLNPIIRKLTVEHIKAQKELSRKSKKQ